MNIILYSIVVAHMLSYVFTRMFRSLDKKHLCMTPALACALATIWLIWLEDFRPLSVQMQRSLAVSYRDVMLSLKWRDRDLSRFSLPITINEHFGTLEEVPNRYDGCSCWAVVTRFRKMPKALLIRNGKLRNFAHVSVTLFPTDLPC